MSSPDYIDLRSDTVTKPTEEMRVAMATAQVGDDVYGEDPTANRLQDRAAEVMGKEAALFVPSGTMGNQIAVRLHTRPGQEVITEAASHVYNYELAAMSALSGVMARPVAAPGGILSWPQIESAIRAKIYYVAQTGLIVLENTHNMAGGTVYTTGQTAAICEQARAAGLPVHLDGARIFNAATALGVDAAALCRTCDSVMFCLSKGLGAPVGSMLAGSRDFIERARSVRKLFGGGMRQVGVLAAAGLVALEKMPRRLVEDHENAGLLARLLQRIPVLDVDPARVQTNVVIVGLARTGLTSRPLATMLRTEGVLVGIVDDLTIRLLTHLDVTRSQIEQAAEIFRQVLQSVVTQ
jgi:threonine aldolase